MGTEQVDRNERGAASKRENDGPGLREQAPPVYLRKKEVPGEKSDADIRDREHHRLKPAAEQSPVAAVGEKDAIDARFDKDEHRKNAKPEKRRGWIMGIARNPVLGFEPLEIGKAAALFPQVSGERRPAGDERLLPLEANLLQIAIEARQDASLLLSLDFPGQGVQMGFGLVELPLQILLETGRNIGESRGGVLARKLRLRVRLPARYNGAQVAVSARIRLKRTMFAATPDRSSGGR